MRIRRVASAFVLLGLLFAAPATEAQAFDHNPMIFVHGFVGSGAQFESQKMRFTSQGYPDDYVTVFEYDSTVGIEVREQLFLQLDQQIADLQQQTGKAQVDILAHSLGTSIMQEYLNSSPERASNVAHYVNIDGQEASSPPGGVPTLAVWAGRGTPDRSIGGAQNVTIPNQTHVQTATSAESFVEYYKFFTGSAPFTKHIVRETGPKTVAGRAVFFPENNGIAGATVEIWEVDSATGQRATANPLASLLIGPNGDFGPVTIEDGKHYEFALLRPGSAPQHHYYEPFVRSDHLIRLLDSDALEAGVEKGPNHSGGVIIRYKELWGDQGSESDILAINGTNVCNAATCPIGHQVNGLFFFDEGSDGQTDLSAPNPVFFGLPFITGVDIFVPAAIPPTGTVSFELTSRGVGPVRTLHVPNFASLTDAIVVQLNDFEQTVPQDPAADLSVGISDSPDPVTAGRPLTYSVTVTNNGAYAAAGIHLTDQLDRKVRLSSARSDQGHCVARRTTVDCDLGDLAEGDSAKVTIVVRPTKKGAVTNTASATAVDPPDPDTTNNTATETTTVMR
jgi:uncharacterized repeat protein (TIGR01451 family)